MLKIVLVTNLIAVLELESLDRSNKRILVDTFSHYPFAKDLRRMVVQTSRVLRNNRGLGFE
jgi:hypothetical protein